MTKRLLAAPLAAAIMLALTGCGGDSHDAIAEDQMQVMDEMVDILSDIDDEASAKAAKPKLEKLGERMKSIEARMEELGDPPADKKAALEEKYKEKMGAVAMKLFAEMMRIGQNEELSKVLEDTMSDLQMN